MKKLKVHPLADAFPMMSEDELRELAEDIKANGLKEKIKVDGAQLLIDGRNRMAACEIAGVEPELEVINEDPIAYIISINVRRRQLTKGQQAMAVAFAYPEPEKGGRGNKKERVDATSTLFSSKRLQIARSVLVHSKPLADAVFKGTISLDDALAQVKGDEEIYNSTEAKLERLRSEAPDLADQVEQERLKLTEALGALEARQRDIQTHIAAARDAARSMASTLLASANAFARGIELGAEIAFDEETEETLDIAVKLIKDTLKTARRTNGQKK